MRPIAAANMVILASSCGRTRPPQQGLCCTAKPVQPPRTVFHKANESAKRMVMRRNAYKAAVTVRCPHSPDARFGCWRLQRGANGPDRYILEIQPIVIAGLQRGIHERVLGVTAMARSTLPPTAPKISSNRSARPFARRALIFKIN